MTRPRTMIAALTLAVAAALLGCFLEKRVK